MSIDAAASRSSEPGPPGAPDPAEQKLDEPAGTVPLRRQIRGWIHTGFRGYRGLLETLSPEISPQEAEDAHRASRRNLKRLSFVAAGIGALLFVTFQVPPELRGLSPPLHDLSGAAFVLGSLLLVTRFRIPFAGRLLGPFTTLLSFYGPPQMAWSFAGYAWYVVALLGAGFLLGAGLDYGASSAPARSRPALRRWTLAVLGIALAVLSWWYRDIYPDYLPLACIGAWVMCTLWGWWPGRALERRAGLNSADAETVREAAMRRLLLFGAGRALAIALGLMPLFVFLYAIEFEKALRWPGPEDPAVRSQRDGEEYVWFWSHKGGYLALEDLAGDPDAGFYGFADSQVEEPTREAIWQLDKELQNAFFEPDNFEELESKFERLEELLEPYRITSEEELQPLLTLALERSAFEEASPNDGAETAEPDRAELYVLERRAVELQSPMRFAPAVLSVEDQLWTGSRRLIPVSEDDIERAGKHYANWQWLLLGSGLLGFTFLWRRGGDSPAARWLGIWLIGLGIAGTYRITQLFLPALGYRMWHEALTSPAANLFLGSLVFVDSLTMTVAVAFIFFVPCGILWTVFCWPAASDPTRPRWRVRLSNLARRSLVVVLMNLVFFGGLELLPEAVPGDFDPSSAAALVATGTITLFILVFFAAGMVLWRRRWNRRVRLLDWLPGALFLTVQATAVAPLILDEPVEIVGRLEALNLFLGLSLLVLAVTLIFRRDLLRVSAARDFSYIITFMVLPALYAVSEDLSKELLSQLTRGILVSPRGAEILGVVVAVALLPPVRRWIERIILYLSIPRFARIERLIRETLETIVDAQDDEAMERVVAALRVCGLERLACYRRADVDRFDRITSPGMECPESIELSEPLRRFLGGRAHFVDLSRVAFEWRFFFVQFELHRLQKRLNASHILPISLGTSLRGLLVVPEAAKGRSLVREPVVGEVAKMGLAAVSLGSVRAGLGRSKAARRLVESAEGLSSS